eukprot:CAMPEP_0196736268 /NCGR_PEP_ID=MMETSP1091-20130531/14390_1 /TAXON_ID=302021 /ORGANISM="Rhodomonas sp., Strain CCMP768" /LENGTH=113 /DNA_ID=CAMNT_0042079977 /DNA_START=13 /DNA_END=356 /DNA_ORIENTATION=+
MRLDEQQAAPAAEGEDFELDDCRVWMRLMFWSARQVGLDQHRPFFKWYVRFISHFIAVYERQAPAYAAVEAEWSADQRNIDKYVADGRIMLDILDTPPEFYLPRAGQPAQRRA